MVKFDIATAKLTPVRGKKPYTPKWEQTPVSFGKIQDEIVTGFATGYGLILGDEWLVLDVDGGDSAAHLEGKVPETVSWTSGRPGRSSHLFVVPDGWRRMLKTHIQNPVGGDAYELRYTGHQSVLPPSKHPVTGGYFWLKSPHEIEVAKVPGWILAEIAKDTRLTGLSSGNQTVLSGLKDGEGRTNSGFSLACDMVGNGVDFEYFQAYGRSCEPPLTDAKIAEIWKSATSKDRSPAKPLKNVDYDAYLQSLEAIKAIDDATRRDWEIAQLSKRVGMSQGVINQHLKNRNANVTSEKPVMLSEYLNQESEPLSWLVDELVSRGELILLTANPKVGKTLLATDLSYCVATGDKFLGMDCQQGKVLIVSTDESPSSCRYKLLNRGFTAGMPVAILHSFSILHLENLEGILKEFRPDLVIIDSLKSVSRNSGVSENSPDFADPVYELKELLYRYGASGILIHHQAKSKEHEGTSRVRGSSAIVGAVNTIWQMDDGVDGTRKLTITSRDYPGANFTIKLDSETFAWERLGEIPAEDTNLQGRIRKLLDSYQGTGLEASEIRDKLNIPDGTYRKTLSRMVQKKLIGKRPNKADGKRPVYYSLNSLENANRDISTMYPGQAPGQGTDVTVDVTVSNAVIEPVSEDVTVLAPLGGHKTVTPSPIPVTPSGQVPLQNGDFSQRFTMDELEDLVMFDEDTE